MSDRAVATDALATLGTIIDVEQKRDAIHLAVEPIVAVEKLYPGQDVGLVPGGAGKCESPVGIVDPFLKTPVMPGQRFWLVVYPRVITSLRHVWAHPAFTDEVASASAAPLDKKAASEAWLRDFCASADCPDYETVVAKAINNEDSWDDDYLHFKGRDAHGEIPLEFWVHIENVTGKKVTKHPNYFSCSC